MTKPFNRSIALGMVYCGSDSKGTLKFLYNMTSRKTGKIAPHFIGKVQGDLLVLTNVCPWEITARLDGATISPSYDMLKRCLQEGIRYMKVESLRGRYIAPQTYKAVPPCCEGICPLYFDLVKVFATLFNYPITGTSRVRNRTQYNYERQVRMDTKYDIVSQPTQQQMTLGRAQGWALQLGKEIKQLLLANPTIPGAENKRLALQQLQVVINKISNEI